MSIDDSTDKYTEVKHIIDLLQIAYKTIYSCASSTVYGTGRYDAPVSVGIYGVHPETDGATCYTCFRICHTNLWLASEVNPLFTSVVQTHSQILLKYGRVYFF